LSDAGRDLVMTRPAVSDERGIAPSPAKSAHALYALAACLTAAACGSEPRGASALGRDGPLLFVSNEGDGSVSIIDVSAGEVLETMPVGMGPRGIQTAPGGRGFLVALSDLQRLSESDADAIVEVDLSASRSPRTFRAGSDPEQFAVSPDGARIYAANEDAGTATILDRRSGAALATLPVGIEPEGVAVSPDGRWVYVAAETSNTVSVIDTAGDSIVSSFLVDVRPRGIAFTPDGREAYVTNEVSGTVSVVDVSTHAVVGSIELPFASKPVGVAVSSDGRVYVASGGQASVFLLARDSRSVVGRIPVGDRPWGVALWEDGRRLYTANGGSHDVSVVDLDALVEIDRIDVGDRPWGVALAERIGDAERAEVP
jgi:PQQ-dependent catabolism-associated beta-propeller protein